jgi:hypothetical protein
VKGECRDWPRWHRQQASAEQTRKESQARTKNAGDASNVARVLCMQRTTHVGVVAHAVDQLVAGEVLVHACY